MSKDKDLDKNLLPTPVIGDRVVWFDRADASEPPVCADVLEIEAPGRVKLKLHRRRPKYNYNEFVDGCWHVSSPHHKEENANTRDCGGWDWLRGICPKDAYEAHRKVLDAKEVERVLEKEATENRLKRMKEERLLEAIR